MAPAELEQSLARAAAIMLLGNRATRAERLQATATLALLGAITNPPHKRAVALRIVPRVTDGKLPSYRFVARSLRIHHVTAQVWIARGLNEIAAAMRAQGSARTETP